MMMDFTAKSSRTWLFIIHINIFFLINFFSFVFCLLSLLEINKVRQNLFQINGVEKKPMTLPEPEGQVVSRQEKVYVPVEEHPEVSVTIGP